MHCVPVHPCQRGKTSGEKKSHDWILYSTQYMGWGCLQSWIPHWLWLHHWRTDPWCTCVLLAAVYEHHRANGRCDSMLPRQRAHPWHRLWHHICISVTGEDNTRTKPGQQSGHCLAPLCPKILWYWSSSEQKHVGEGKMIILLPFNKKSVWRSERWTAGSMILTVKPLAFNLTLEPMESMVILWLARWCCVFVLSDWQSPSIDEASIHRLERAEHWQEAPFFCRCESKNCNSAGWCLHKLGQRGNHLLNPDRKLLNFCTT